MSEPPSAETTSVAMNCFVRSSRRSTHTHNAEQHCRRYDDIVSTKKSTSTIAVFVIMMTVAHAEPRPGPKPQGPGGSCPHGYISSGSFCAPSQGAQDAIPKPSNGTCPWGWTSSGSFCLRSGSGR
jgi:hypothetical protein